MTRPSGSELLDVRMRRTVAAGVFVSALLMFMTAFSLAGSTATLRDGTSPLVEASGLPVVQWSNSDVPTKAVIIALHGATQQAGSFDVLANHLADQGYLIVGLDLRGHGRWYFGAGRKKGGQAIDYNQSVKDLEVLATELRKTYPDLPLICIGESTGAAVAMHAVSEQPKLLDALLMASAGTRPNIFNMKLILPDLVKGLSNLDRPLDGAPYILRYASEDKRIVNEMVADPLSRSFLTGKEILRTLFFINSMQGTCRQMPEKLPVLVLQGGLDHIVSPATVETMMRNMSCKDKRMVTFPESGHVMLGTGFIKPQIMRLVTNWLNDQTDEIIAARQASGTLTASTKATNNAASNLASNGRMLAPMHNVISPNVMAKGTNSNNNSAAATALR